MKKWQLVLLGILILLAVVIAVNFSLVRILCCNMFAPKIKMDESTAWAGGVSEHLLYGESESQYVDLYVPDGTEQPPLFVLVHGGGFVANDAHSRQAQFMYRYFRDHGFACATVNYRLAGEAPFPAACEDVHAAVVLLAEKAEQYGYNADRIAIWGESAGAYLATREALTETDANIAALVSYYGCYDFLAAEDQFINQGFPGIPKWIRKIANNWLSGTCGGYSAPEEYWLRKEFAEWTEEDIEAASVQYIAEKEAANPELKVYIIHGLADITVPYAQSVNLAEALRQRYGEENVTFRLVDGFIHGDDRLYADEQLQEVAQFIENALAH